MKIFLENKNEVKSFFKTREAIRVNHKQKELQEMLKECP
jgi:hypothetical protein